MSKTLVSRTGQALMALWRCVRAQARHERLDDATLRDLGINRSELMSFGAEAEGSIEVTRLRIANRRAAGV